MGVQMWLCGGSIGLGRPERVIALPQRCYPKVFSNAVPRSQSVFLQMEQAVSAGGGEPIRSWGEAKVCKLSVYMTVPQWCCVVGRPGDPEGCSNGGPQDCEMGMEVNPDCVPHQ